MMDPLIDVDALSPEERELFELMLEDEGIAEEPSTSIPRREPGAAAPLSFGQWRLWILDRLDPGSAAYNIPTALRLVGPLEIRALEAALREVVRRHEILRTTFEAAGEEARQVIHPEPRAELPVIDLRALAAPDRRPEADRRMRADARRAFDLERGPLLRARLFALDAEEHLALFNIHHIASDGWSTGVMVGELTELYRAASKGRPSPLAELAIQYADYAAWQRAELDEAVLAAEIDFWRARLGTEPPVIELPFDRPRPSVRRWRGASRSRRLPPAAIAAVDELGREREATRFTIFLAAYQALLGRYSGQKEVVVGTPIAGRDRVEIEELIGFFVNTLVLHGDLRGAGSFAELVELARGATLEASDHARVPFEKLAAELEPERVGNRTPLFQVFFVVEEAPRRTLEFPGLRIEQVPVALEAAKFDLTLIVQTDGRHLLVHFEYDVDLFDAATLERALDHYANLLRAGLVEPEAPLAELEMLGAGERHQLLVEHNDTAAERPGDTLLHGLVAERAALSPERVALEAEGAQLSYGVLDRRARALGEVLRAEGVGPDRPVAVALERSLELAVAILGVLHAGGAWVPLDPGYPRERHVQILRDVFGGAHRALVVGRGEALEAALEEAFGPASPALIDPAAGAASGELAGGRTPTRPENLAYVLHTSGSTGRPKGVMVSHGAICEHLLWARAERPLGGEDAVLQKIPMNFDVSVNELFWPLVSGARLVVARPGGHRDDAYLVERVEDRRVTVLHALPSTLEIFLGERARERCATLKLVVTGGESLGAERAERLASRSWARLEHQYGPTEAAVVVTSRWAWPLAADRRMPIGRPIENTEIHLTDGGLRPVALGVAGELVIGGVALARGYSGLPARTAQVFVPDPFATARGGARLYRTGDLARRLADGEVEFLGRFDHQVKVRGFRIELGEIEAALAEHPGLDRSAVLARPLESGADAGHRRLVAFVAARDGHELTADGLRRYLARRLPEHMVPSRFVTLDEMPLLPNGKLDRRSLARRELPRLERTVSRPPSTAEETALARVWAEVLGFDEVGVDENFFQLGGDSILALQVISRAARAGLRLSARQLFEHPTVAALATVVERAEASDDEPGAVVGPVPLTPIQRWFFAQELPRPEHFNQALLLEVAGPRLPVAVLSRALAELGARHDALRQRFEIAGDGPPAVRDAGSPGLDPALEVDLRALDPDHRSPALERCAARAQASLDLERGPLVRCLLFDFGEGEAQRFSWIAHHLVVDGVSWRILLEDLETACRQLAGGRALELPPRTAPYGLWAQRLGELAERPELLAEAGFWRRFGELSPPELPAGGESGPGGAVGTRVATLDAETTARLLEALPRVYGARLDDLVLTALTEAAAELTGERRLWVDFEGHGREELDGAPDITRTVGWFTNVYPVLFDLEGRDGPGAALKTVKETLRAVPRGGFAYSLVRHLGPEAVRRELEALPPAPVIYNYLGRLDREVGGDRLFRGARESAGATRFAGQVPSHALEVNGAVQGGALRVVWRYHRRALAEAAAGRWQAAFERSLESLAEHCLSPGVWGRTPSDFPLAGLGQAELDRLIEERAAPFEDLYPATPIQEGILFHTLSAPDSGVYVEQVHLALGPELDAGAFRRAWEGLIRRHAVLRTAFSWLEQDRMLQVVEGEVELPWEDLDWRQLSAEEEKRRLEAFLEADRRRGFELEKAPLMRFALLGLGARGHRFVWTQHHAVSDGWSLGVELREIFELYRAAREGRPPELPPARPYRDHVAWLEGREHGAAEDFWRRELSGLEGPTPLPEERPAPSGRGQGIVRRHLSPERSAALEAAARAHGVTLNTLVQGAWALTLARFGGVEDVVFGAVASGRSAPVAGIEEMVGLFINTLPVRAPVEAELAAGEWLRRLQARQAEARQFEHTPLAELQRWSGLGPRTPLFETLLVVENYPIDRAARQGLGSTLGIGEVGISEQTHYPVTVIVEPGARLSARLLYRRERFHAVTAARLLEHFERTLSALAEEAGRPLAEVSGLAPAERHRLVHEWRREDRAAGGMGTPEGWFEKQARERGDAVAVVRGAEAWSWAELERRAEALAGRLRGLGVGPDDRVGLCLGRGVERVLAVLAVFKVGAAAVPLDPGHPPRRLLTIVEEALGDRARRWVVADRDALAGLAASELGPALEGSGVGVLRLDARGRLAEPPPGSSRPAPAPPSPADLAYVIYTSGSTGRPKGVALPRGALVNLIDGQSTAPPLDAPARVLQFASLGFDVAFQEILSAWRTGGTLVSISAREQRDPRELAAAIVRARVERLFSPAVALRQLAEVAAELPGSAWVSLADVVVAGEQLQVTPAVGAWLGAAGCRLHNHYGPSETHVVTAWTGAAGGPWPELPPIGRPVPGCEVRLLDRRLRLAPAGAVGEVCLGGAQLARGYLDRPGLTAERFVPDPVAVEPGARLYRTGDLARWRPDGELDFLGRGDAQVKVRGLRVEPGEVETALGRHPGVGEVVVVADGEAGAQRLVAYFVAEGAAPAAAELRRFLAVSLPEAMVPSLYVALDELPLTATGKVDRRALPDPGTAAVAQRDFVAPQGPLEEVLAEIWAEVLGVERVGADDDFFELGGHSLLATRVVSRLRRTLRVELPLAVFFEGETPTVAVLAREIAAREERPGESEKIARAWLAVRRMSASELAEKLGTRERAGVER